MGKENLESKKGILIIILSVVVIAVIGVLIFFQTATDVEVDTVIKSDIYRTVEDTGKVMSERSLDLQASGSGKVIQIHVEVGDVVEAGEILVSIDERALTHQLESLEYQIKSLESNIAYLEDPYSDLSLKSYSDSVQIARENYLKAKGDYEKAIELFELGAISQSELDSLELLSTVGRINYNIALNESNAASMGGDDDLVQQYNFQLQALIPQLEGVKDQIAECQIRAPFDGTVGEIYVEEDGYVVPMTPVVQIYENKYYVESSLLEESLVLMELDAPVEISFDSVVVEGIIRKIHPRIKTVFSDLGVAQQKGIVEIAVEHDFKLMGREVELKFMLGRRQEVLTVDKHALIRYGRDDYVYVVEDNRVAFKKVSVGAKGNERYEILDGLQENDIVVINPENEVEDGDRVSY